MVMTEGDHIPCCLDLGLLSGRFALLDGAPHSMHTGGRSSKFPRGSERELFPCVELFL